MFDQGAVTGWNWPKTLGVYFLQFLISYPLTYLIAVAVQRIFSSAGLIGKDGDGILFAGYLGVMCIGVGAGVGWSVSHWTPSFTSTGHWIWVLPTVIAIPEVFYELFRQQQIPWLPESLFVAGGNEGLGVYLFTLPTCSAVGYSIGTFLNRTTAHGVVATAKAIAAFVSALALLILLAHSVESDRIARWKTVRSVIDPGGLGLSAEAIDTCGSRASGSRRGAVLFPGTYVEMIEQRACDDGQIADRVRVLNGSRAGQDGWVLDYGLLGY